MTVVKKGDGNLDSGGKPLPPEGEFKYIFNGVAVLCGKGMETLRIEAEYPLDTEGTKPVSCFCFLGNEKGLESLMSIISDTKVYEKLMAKNKSLPPVEDGWDDEEVLKDPKFIEQLGIELVGCTALLTTKHEPNEWEDEKGNKRVGKNSKVVSIRPCVEGGAGGASSKGVEEDGEEAGEENWD